MNFKSTQSKSLCFPGNVNAIGLEGKNKQGEFLFARAYCFVEPTVVFIHRKSSPIT